MSLDSFDFSGFNLTLNWSYLQCHVVFSEEGPS